MGNLRTKETWCDMSYRCTAHGWSHLLSRCPSCSPNIATVNNNTVPHFLSDQENKTVEQLAKENANLLLAAKSWQREAEIEAEHVKELKDNVEKLELLLSDKSCCCAGCTKHNIALEEKYEVNDEMNK